jgi:hypothetical protein
MGLQLEQPEVDLDDMPGYRGAVESTEKAMRNLPRSFKEEGGALVDAAIHPWETAKSLARVGAGGVQKGVKALGGDIGEGYIPYANAVGQVYSDRYGSWDKARKTYEENPVALMGDLATLFTGGGVAARAAGLSKTGKAANFAAKVFDPLTVPMAVADTATAPVRWLGKKAVPSAERVYGSAIKGLSALPVEAQKQIIETGLKERILPTEGGYGKIQDIQSEVGSEVGRLIDERAAAELAGDVPMSINADDILKRAFTHVRDSEKGPYKVKRWKEAAKAGREYHKGNKGPLDTRSAQDLKKGAQEEASSTYAETGGKPPMDKQLANAIAHETRVDIEKAVPGVAPLNARLHNLYPLETILGKAIGREAGRNLVSLPSHVVGAGLGGIPGMVSVGALNLARLPGVKGRAAFALDSLRKPRGKKMQFFMDAQRPMRAGAHVASLLDLLAEEERKKK